MERRQSRVTIYRRANKVNGHTYEQFRFPVYDADGIRTYRTFRNWDEAWRAADAHLDALNRGSGETLVLSGHDRLEYLELKRMLPAGSSLRAAGEALLEKLKTPTPTSITVPALIALYLESRRHSTRRGLPASGDYLADLRNRLAKFGEAFQTDVANLTGPRIEAWIDAIGQQGRNRFNTLRIVRGLLKWAQKKGYLPEGKLCTETLEITEPVDVGAIEIFTAEELGRLLHAAKETMLPYVAIGAFAGLRTAEIVRLDWSEIRLDRGFIEVTAAKAKTKSRRLVPIVPALAAWLRPIRKEAGLVLPYANQAKQIGWLARAAGVEWKHNALRHSFVSYRLATTESAEKVALEAGNSPAMIFKHYRELVTREQAEAWFSVMPDSAAASNELAMHPAPAALAEPGV